MIVGFFWTCMTRIAGTNIIKAPCCCALYSTTALASINFMANEHQTDGQVENSLSQTDGGLRRCTCCGYFLSGYAELVGFIPKNAGQQQEQSKYSIAKIFGKIGKLLIAEDKTKPHTIRKLPSQWAANETAIPKKAESVNGAAIAELLDSKPQDKNLSIQARRLYWRYLNNQFFDEYREYRDVNKMPAQYTHPSRYRWITCSSLHHYLQTMSWSMNLSLESYTAKLGNP